MTNQPTARPTTPQEARALAQTLAERLTGRWYQRRTWYASIPVYIERATATTTMVVGPEYQLRHRPIVAVELSKFNSVAEIPGNRPEWAAWTLEDATRILQRSVATKAEV